MKSHIYYGEYTLTYWIELMLKGNIQLPGYQRYFVWGEDSVKKLVKSLVDDQFVPPITIGLFKENDKTINYILDGQQRLTSILLAYLQLFPKSEKEARNILIEYVDGNDDDTDITDELKDIQDWTLKKITELGNNREEILKKYQKNLYNTVDYDTPEDFFKNKFLGFSYIVPDVVDEEEQQRYYSSVFRNINIQGLKLLPAESRKALYFLNSNLENFFDPSLDVIKLANTSSNKKVDFVKYLSLLSQYHNVLYWFYLTVPEFITKLLYFTIFYSYGTCQMRM